MFDKCVLIMYCKCCEVCYSLLMCVEIVVECCELDQSHFKGACRHGPQNNSTVKKVAQASQESWFPIEGLAKTSMATIIVSF